VQVQHGLAVRHPSQFPCDEEAHAHLVPVNIAPSVGAGVTKIVCAQHHSLVLLASGQVLELVENFFDRRKFL
jgi:hypothetical protein